MGMYSISFTICSFFFILITTVSYFAKQRLNSNENHIYSKLLICAIIGLLIDMSGFLVLTYLGESSIWCKLLFKANIIYYFTWIYLFTLYVYVISYEKQISGSFQRTLYIFYFVVSLLLIALPLNIYNENNVTYTYGQSVMLMYIISIFCIIYMLFCLFTRFNKTTKFKYIPLFVFIIFGTLIMIVQFLNPSLLLLITGEAIVTCLVFHTIENPDMKMVEELYKNKTIIEKNNESTSNILFKISQDIKYPVNKIINESSEYDNYKQRLKSINNMSKDLRHTINEILDVSSMTTKELKVYDTRYNPKNLFNEVKTKIENELGFSVKLEYNLSPNIPKCVYGDSIKLKQILLSILENSLKNTATGFISIEVNTIIKYGICRFIIDISDSGKGISIDKVNQILSLDEIKEKHDFDNSILNLIEVRALIQKLNGNFMIKSELDKGTTVSVSIDQKIAESHEKSTIKSMQTYENITKKGIKVIVIDDDAEELAQITSYLEKNNIIVSGSLFGKEVIENIKNHQKYDLIILDDETNTYSALAVLNELMKIKGFSIPVIVMINDNKEFIKKHYLKDGFNDIIKKSDLKKEVKRIIKNIK